MNAETLTIQDETATNGVDHTTALCINLPDNLRQLGPVRIARFVQDYADDLHAAGLVLPEPDPNGANDNYLNAVSEALASPLLPERLRAVLVAIEHLAAPEHAETLQSASDRYLPCISLQSPLDRALELAICFPNILLELAATCHSPIGSSQALQNSTTRRTPLFGPSSPTSSSSSSSSSSVQPLPTPHSAVDIGSGRLLLDELVHLLGRFLILPQWAPETIALWIVHTYAFELREVTTYLGIESPEKRCGKTTLLGVLTKLVHRPVASSNISSPALFRVIQELRPTLLIDEADTFMEGNDELRGILNAGYHVETAYVMRVSATHTDSQDALDANPRPGKDHRAPPQPSRLARYSCWCPKAMARIGRLPDTLADRCIVIRMQRKTPNEECERLRKLDATALRNQCARFVADHGPQIAAARPAIPPSLNDRAADIWEPLLALADLAGGDWPEKARQAAVALTASSQDSNPVGALLLDIFIGFATMEVDQMFTRTLVDALNRFGDRPWSAMRKGKELSPLWLAQQLAPYSIRPRMIWIDNIQARGYLRQDFMDVFRRYIPRSEIETLKELAQPSPPAPETAKP